jgi:hypothetical protein
VDQAAGVGERDLAESCGIFVLVITVQMMFPLVRDLAAGGVPVAVACRVAGFSKLAIFK